MARFRFKAVAPSSEVVEGELEANDRQAAIGRLRELNHLPVRVEEMREGPLRRRGGQDRAGAERIEPRLAAPPSGSSDRTWPERPEPQLMPPPQPSPPSPEAGRPEPPPSRSPIVRLREVLRGSTRAARQQEPIVSPPASPEIGPTPVLEATVGEPAPPAPHVAAAVERPPEPAPAGASLWEEEQEAQDEKVEAAAEPVGEPPTEEPVPVESLPPGFNESPPSESEPASAASSEPEVAEQPPRLHVVGHDEQPYLPSEHDASAPVEPLPMRWDTTPAELPSAPTAGEEESSADRWLREVEQAREDVAPQPADEQLGPAHEEPVDGGVASAEPAEPVLDGSGRAIVPAIPMPPPVAFEDLAPGRERDSGAGERREAPFDAKAGAKAKAKPKRGRRALPARLVPVFTRELQVLLSAGLPMDQALRIIVESTADDRVAAAADALLARVRGGALLSEAMEALPDQFDEFLRTAVRAGEAGGSLAEVLGQVAQYQERGQALERSVKTALIYPTILAFAAALSVTLLLTLVVPQFEALLRQSAQAPPLATRFVIAASVFVRAYGWILPAAGLVLWLLTRWRMAGLRGRARLHARLLRLPLVGKVVAGVSVERLARALGTLLANGVALPEALPLVANAIPNRAVGTVVAAAAERVKQGERLADALEDGRVLPSLAVQLIRVGEEGGRLGDMLARVAEIYAGDVDVAVRRVTAVVEPLLILAIGIIVGGIVLSLLAAITGLNTLAL